MTEKTANALLSAATEVESAAFRTGQVARRLLAEHPQLTLRKVTCSAYSSVDSGYHDEPFVPKLELRADSLDSARAWALALGGELTLTTRDATSMVLETGELETTVDGVLITVRGTHVLSADEAAAWRSQQAQAADGGEG